MQRVLFVVHDRYQDDNQFPLNVAYLSSVLEQSGCFVEVYCMDVYHYTNMDLAKKLDGEEWDVIGVGFLAARFKETVVDLCKTINDHKKDAWLVLGGHGASPIPEFMLETVGCDAVVVGEAELSILELMKDRKVGINKRIYHGRPIRNLDSIPLPAWHLFPVDKYVDNMRFDGKKFMQILSSRGCVNECTFCYRLEKGIRLRSMGNFVDEIIILNDKYGVDTFQFQDELFLISEKRFDEFSRALNDSGLDISYTANARVDVLSEGLAYRIKDSGCALLNVGFESSDQTVLDYMKKNVTVKQNIDALEVLKKVGLPSGLNFIWGFPPDTRRSLLDNVKLIKRYNLYKQIRTVRPVTCYPGCRLYYEAVDKGLISGAKDFFDRFKNSDLITVNHTGFDDRTCYSWLFDANRDLIRDHFFHTTGNPDDGDYLVQQFYDLYTGRSTSFRGSRHYNKKTGVL